MINKIEDIKFLNYERFKCIADKCKYTCCSGWDINIDSCTYKKWGGTESAFFLDNVIERETGYIIDKETSDACTFLDCNGLCNIVKDYGDDYLSLTCKMFPRIINEFEGRRELSLSCSCPEVVELISKEGFDIANLKNNDLLELRIRETLINIINMDDFKIEYKLIVAFQMLSFILESEDISDIEKFNNKEYISKLIEMYSEIDLNIDESIEEINGLFLDIIENYKEVPLLKDILEDISEFSEGADIEELSNKWGEYKNLFEEQEKLIKDCIISKVISSCISDDIEELTISFELIVIEYLLVRHALFLKYCMEGMNKIGVQDIKDYIVIFSRVIGNNTEAVVEFFRDGFDDAVLEVGYLSFISLF